MGSAPAPFSAVCLADQLVPFRMLGRWTNIRQPSLDLALGILDLS